MRKPFNKQLNTDITALKKLHAKKDKTEFNRLKAEIMKRHNISKATVYRELKKTTPGLYKEPQYDPPERPVTEREKQLAKGLLEKQYSVQDVCSAMERELGENYSWDRVDKIRKAIEDSEVPIENLGGLEIQKTGEDLAGGGEARRNIRVLIEDILGIDTEPEGGLFGITVAGREITISRDAVRDILLIIANYADAGEHTLAEMNRLRLQHITSDKVRQLSLGGYVSVRELKELVQMSSALAEAEKSASKSTDYVSMILRANDEKEESDERMEFYRALEAGEKPYLPENETGFKKIPSDDHDDENISYWDPETRIFGPKSRHEEAAREREKEKNHQPV